MAIPITGEAVDDELTESLFPLSEASEGDPLVVDALSFLISRLKITVAAQALYISDITLSSVEVTFTVTDGDEFTASWSTPLTSAADFVDSLCYSTYGYACGVCRSNPKDYMPGLLQALNFTSSSFEPSDLILHNAVIRTEPAGLLKSLTVKKSDGESQVVSGHIIFCGVDGCVARFSNMPRAIAKGVGLMLVGDPLARLKLDYELRGRANTAAPAIKTINGRAVSQAFTWGSASDFKILAPKGLTSDPILTMKYGINELILYIRGMG